MPTPHYKRLEAIETTLSALDDVRQELECYAYYLDNLKGWQIKCFRPYAARAEPLASVYRPGTQPYQQALERHAQIKAARRRLNVKMQALRVQPYGDALINDIRRVISDLEVQHCTDHPNEHLIDEYRAWLILNDEYQTSAQNNPTSPKDQAYYPY